MNSRADRIDPQHFIRQNPRLAEMPGLPGIRLHTAHPGSGLNRVAAKPPYWAYPWAGGLALARHVLDRSESVRGRRVLDLGAGGGIVGIAAAKSGARSVLAAEIDPYGLAALVLNAAANNVELSVSGEDLLPGEPPDVDVVLVGDLFYEAGLGRRVTTFLDRCVDAGIAVLVGDPGRAPLPRESLQPIACYHVPDFGDAGHLGISTIFRFG